MVNLIFLGPPGAGKGTLSEEICWQENLLHLSTGDLLRSEIKQGTELGQEVQSIVQSGALVPDEIVAKLVENYLRQLDESTKGLIFDGYPRTIGQAKLLDGILKKLDLDLDAVVLLEVMEEVLILRLTGRRICRQCNKIYHLAYSPPKQDGVCDQCGGHDIYQRPDDNEESVRERLAVYERETLPLVEHYERTGKLLRIDASRDKPANIAALRTQLSPIFRRAFHS